MALLVALGLAAMCTVVTTASPMNGHSTMSTTSGSVAAAGPDFLVPDVVHPMVMSTERACADCSTAECGALGILAALGLLGLLLLALGRRRPLTFLRRRAATVFRGIALPPPLSLTPPRFQLCVLRV